MNFLKCFFYVFSFSLSNAYSAQTGSVNGIPVEQSNERQEWRNQADEAELHYEHFKEIKEDLQEFEEHYFQYMRHMIAALNTEIYEKKSSVQRVNALIGKLNQMQGAGYEVENYFLDSDVYGYIQRYLGGLLRTYELTFPSLVNHISLYHHGKMNVEWYLFGKRSPFRRKEHTIYPLSEHGALGNFIQKTTDHRSENSIKVQEVEFSCDWSDWSFDPDHTLTEKNVYYEVDDLMLRAYFDAYSSPLISKEDIRANTRGGIIFNILEFVRKIEYWSTAPAPSLLGGAKRAFSVRNAIRYKVQYGEDAQPLVEEKIASSIDDLQNAVMAIQNTDRENETGDSVLLADMVDALGRLDIYYLAGFLSESERVIVEGKVDVIMGLMSIDELGDNIDEKTNRIFRYLFDSYYRFLPNILPESLTKEYLALLSKSELLRGILVHSLNREYLNHEHGTSSIVPLDESEQMLALNQLLYFKKEAIDITREQFSELETSLSSLADLSFDNERAEITSIYQKLILESHMAYLPDASLLFLPSFLGSIPEDIQLALNRLAGIDVRNAGEPIGSLTRPYNRNNTHLIGFNRYLEVQDALEGDKLIPSKDVQAYKSIKNYVRSQRSLPGRIFGRSFDTTVRDLFLKKFPIADDVSQSTSIAINNSQHLINIANSGKMAINALAGLKASTTAGITLGTATANVGVTLSSVMAITTAVIGKK